MLSSAQVIMIMEYTGDYSRRAEVHWIHTFLDNKVLPTIVNQYILDFIHW